MANKIGQGPVPFAGRIDFFTIKKLRALVIEYKKHGIRVSQSELIERGIQLLWESGETFCDVSVGDITENLIVEMEGE